MLVVNLRKRLKNQGRRRNPAVDGPQPALVLEIIEGTAAKASKAYDLTPSKIESALDDALRGCFRGAKGIRAMAPP